MTQSACFSHEASPPVSRWPGLPSREVVIGGVPVTCAQAVSALDVLGRAGGAAIRQVLAAVSSPLAACDYHAAAAPFTDACRDHPGRAWGRGAAGRPVTKTAFIRAIREALAWAETTEPARHFAAELAGAREAFSSDSGYATAMARAAVAVRERDHGARLRERLAAAVHGAVEACGSSPGSGGHRGEFTCAAVSACGTGDCRLADAGLGGPLAGLSALSMSSPAMTVPAGAGRIPRPANHAQAGTGFGTGAALAALEACVPFDVLGAVNTVTVAGADGAAGADAPA